MALNFSGRVLSPIDGIVQAVGFNSATHRFEITIRY